MKKRIISTIIAFILCFPLHFLYNILPNPVTAIVSPVNESIWEHMKLLFTSILLASTYDFIKKNNKNNIFFSNFIAAISSIPIFLTIFLPIYYIIGENFIITISIMFIAILVSELISSKIMSIRELNLNILTIILIIITYIIFIVLTYNPPKIDLFMDPTSNTYSTSK